MTIPFNHVNYMDSVILFAICLFVIAACICRVNALGKRHAKSWAITYILIGTLCLFSMVYLATNVDPDGYSHTVSWVAGVTSAHHIAATWRRWRGSPPKYMEKDYRE